MSVKSRVVSTTLCLQALWQELLGELQSEMTPEVAAALHAEIHAMSRALAALNRAITACKANQRSPACPPAAHRTAANDTAGVQQHDACAHSGAVQRDSDGQRNSAMHAHNALDAVHTDSMRPCAQAVSEAHPQTLAQREQQRGRTTSSCTSRQCHGSHSSHMHICRSCS
jgi:hypothetical protein